MTRFLLACSLLYFVTACEKLEQSTISLNYSTKTYNTTVSFVDSINKYTEDQDLALEEKYTQAPQYVFDFLKLALDSKTTNYFDGSFGSIKLEKTTDTEAEQKGTATFNDYKYIDEMPMINGKIEYTFKTSNNNINATIKTDAFLIQDTNLDFEATYTLKKDQNGALYGTITRTITFNNTKYSKTLVYGQAFAIKWNIYELQDNSVELISQSILAGSKIRIKALIYNPSLIYKVGVNLKADNNVNISSENYNPVFKMNNKDVLIVNKLNSFVDDVNLDSTIINSFIPSSYYTLTFNVVTFLSQTKDYTSSFDIDGKTNIVEQAVIEKIKLETNNLDKIQTSQNYYVQFNVLVKSTIPLNKFSYTLSGPNGVYDENLSKNISSEFKNCKTVLATDPDNTLCKNTTTVDHYINSYKLDSSFINKYFTNGTYYFTNIKVFNVLGIASNIFGKQASFDIKNNTGSTNPKITETYLSYKNKNNVVIKLGSKMCIPSDDFNSNVTVYINILADSSSAIYNYDFNLHSSFYYYEDYTDKTTRINFSNNKAVITIPVVITDKDNADYTVDNLNIQNMNLIKTSIDNLKFSIKSDCTK